MDHRLKELTALVHKNWDQACAIGNDKGRTLRVYSTQGLEGELLCELRGRSLDDVLVQLRARLPQGV